MKTFTKNLLIGLLWLISAAAYAQSCKGIGAKYKLDTIKTTPNWSVPTGAHLDSIYGGFQRPGYTGTALSYSCYSQGTTNDTNLINPASNYYYPYSGPYNAWIKMGAHNVIGLSNSLIQFSITTASGMVMDSVKIAYSCATGCSGITRKYVLDYHGTGSTWSYANLALPDGAYLDSVYGGIQRPGYTGAALSYSCYSDSSTNNVNLLNTSTSTFGNYTGPYNQWINVASYNVVGKANSFVQFSITEANGMIFDSAKIAYSCSTPTGINELSNTLTEIHVYPNPATEIINIQANNQKIDEVVITDMLGKQIYDKPFIGQVNISDLPDGMYIISEISKSGSIYRQKFIKQ